MLAAGSANALIHQMFDEPSPRGAIRRMQCPREGDRVSLRAMQRVCDHVN